MRSGKAQNGSAASHQKEELKFQVIDVVTKLKYGNTNTFFVRGTAGSLLIDTDYAGTLPLFYRAIKEHNIRVRDIDYVLATHYHPDHIGLISELIKQGVKLLLLDTQLSYIHFSDGIFSRDLHLNYEPITTETATVIRSEDSRNFLKRIGIDGEIVVTQSHSEDSVSLILDNGACFVGDLEPMEYLGGYEQNEKLKSDWDLVMRYAPKVIHYAHANKKIL